jgi:predicted phosphodiesterase
MTLELLFSDVHYGKLIDNVEGNYVNLEEIRKRVRKVSESVVKEINRESKSFNVERIIVAMIGDIIENSDFHGMESTRACEFSTARQVSEAIKSIFFDLILPIAMTGIQMDIPCVTGNHDRNGKDKTYQKPGEQNHTHTIYKTLELLCQQAGLKNVKFNIILGLYTSTEVYSNTIVYEHGDELKNLNRDTMANQMNKRQTQLGKLVHFYRVGHWHEPAIYGQGRMIVNGSVPGQDDYADAKGFCSEAIQIMNYYVKTEKRSTCFFRSFPIYLQQKE